MVRSGILWYTVVYCGTLWYTIKHCHSVHCGTLWYIREHLWFDVSHACRYTVEHVVLRGQFGSLGKNMVP